MSTTDLQLQCIELKINRHLRYHCATSVQLYTCIDPAQTVSWVIHSQAKGEQPTQGVSLGP